MNVQRLAYLLGGGLFVGGCVALYRGGIWADENQQAGSVWLWLVPLLGIVVIVAARIILSRRRGSSRR